MSATTVQKLDGGDRWAISVPEAGRRLAISRAHAYRLVASGELPSVRLGHRMVVPIRAIERLLDGADDQRSAFKESTDVERTLGASASGGSVGEVEQEVHVKGRPC